MNNFYIEKLVILIFALSSCSCLKIEHESYINEFPVYIRYQNDFIIHECNAESADIDFSLDYFKKKYEYDRKGCLYYILISKVPTEIDFEVVNFLDYKINNDFNSIKDRDDQFTLAALYVLAAWGEGLKKTNGSVVFDYNKYREWLRGKVGRGYVDDFYAVAIIFYYGDILDKKLVISKFNKLDVESKRVAYKVLNNRCDNESKLLLKTIKTNEKNWWEENNGWFSCV